MENIKGIILDYGGTVDTDGLHWSKVIQEAWIKANVMTDDALFHEAYVYAEQELERTLEILPHYNFSDLLNIKIRLELQYLASKGHFSPDAIDDKTSEISAYCYNVAKEGIYKSKPIIEKLAAQ